MKKLSSYLLLLFLLLGLMPAIVADAAPVKSVMYFYGSTCSACKEVAPVIEKMIARGIPLEKYEMFDNRENMDRLAMLFKLNGIPEHEWAVPVAFYNGQVYMGIPRILELEKDLASSPEAAAGSLSAPDVVGIMGAALADSVNPCAISVLVILLSFISLYHESRKRLILSAASFISSIFITYMLIGVGIVKALTFLGITELVRNGIGVLAIVVGVVNLKDFFVYGAGGFATEIPQSWRPFLFSLLRRATTPLAAFAMGAVVTLIELPCTGGPYFFALGILAKWGLTPQFFAYLILYNLIFISPLIAISVLVYLGKLSVEKASDWQARNSKRLHLAVGLLMVAAGFAVLLT